MTDEIVNLGSERARRAADALRWTPVEMLRALVADIEAWRIAPDRAYVAMTVPTGNGGTDHPYYQAGLTNLEVVGLLAQHLHFRAAP